jgi:hypothetical protein
MAVPDDYGRLRLLILDQGPDGHYDSSARALREQVPPLHPGYRTPYTLREGPLGPDAEGVRGEACVAIPAHLRKHWLGVATAARGKWVRAEVTVRPYRFEAAGTPLTGAALDLAALEELGRAGDN